MENVIVDCDILFNDDQIANLLNNCSKLVETIKKLPQYAFTQIRLKLKNFIDKHYFNKSAEDYSLLYFERRDQLELLLSIALQVETIYLNKLKLSQNIKFIPISYLKLAQELENAANNWEKIYETYSKIKNSYYENCKLTIDINFVNLKL